MWGGGLAVVGSGVSLMTLSAGFVTTQSIYAMASEHAGTPDIYYKTGHGRFAIHKDLLF